MFFFHFFGTVLKLLFITFCVISCRFSTVSTHTGNPVQLPHNYIVAQSFLSETFIRIVLGIDKKMESFSIKVCRKFLYFVVEIVAGCL